MQSAKPLHLVSFGHILMLLCLFKDTNNAGCVPQEMRKERQAEKEARLKMFRKPRDQIVFK